MIYTKIKNNNVLIYPYEFSDLRQENHNTVYDKRFDLVGWFNQTDIALIEGCKLEEVSIGDKPSINVDTQYLITDLIPTLVNGVWTIETHIRNYTDEELLARINDNNTGGE